MTQAPGDGREEEETQMPEMNVERAGTVVILATGGTIAGVGEAGRTIGYRPGALTVEDLRSKGVSPVYLLTDHTGFYERYGWEFYCMAQGDGEETMSRMYVHR